MEIELIINMPLCLIVLNEALFHIRIKIIFGGTFSLYNTSNIWGNLKEKRKFRVVLNKLFPYNSLLCIPEFNVLEYFSLFNEVPYVL